MLIILGMTVLLLILSIILMASTSDWLMIWFSLELNMMSFLFFLILFKMKSETTMIYFLIQSISSLGLVSGVIINIKMNNLFFNSMIISFLMVKLAIAPFHLWMHKLIPQMNKESLFLILSIQKLPPLCIMSVFFFSKTWFLILGVSALMGSIMGLMFLNLKMVLFYSSVSHTPWMLSFMLSESSWWKNYFMIYTLNLLMVIYYIQFSWMKTSDQKMTLINLLSLGGFPPFLGFYPKAILMWISSNKMILLFLMWSSLINIYFYIRLLIKPLINSNFLTFFSSLPVNSVVVSVLTPVMFFI